MNASFSITLVETLSEKHLLKHPFYQKWSDGALSMESLQTYAGQYYHHVKAFPRYLSATHSNCSELSYRQFLLENLNDEEAGSENHPELWARFAEGAGVSRQRLESTPADPAVKNLVDTFMSLSRSSFEEGLGALFAYEHQVPEIAKFKNEALEKYYGFKDPKHVAFFEVHQKADIYHTQALSKIIDELPEAKKAVVRESAKVAANALWSFLDAMPCH